MFVISIQQIRLSDVQTVFGSPSVHVALLTNSNHTTCKSMRGNMAAHLTVSHDMLMQWQYFLAAKWRVKQISVATVLFFLSPDSSSTQKGHHMGYPYWSVQNAIAYTCTYLSEFQSQVSSSTPERYCLPWIVSHIAWNITAHMGVI